MNEWLQALKKGGAERKGVSSQTHNGQSQRAQQPAVLNARKQGGGVRECCLRHSPPDTLTLKLHTNERLK